MHPRLTKPPLQTRSKSILALAVVSLVNPISTHQPEPCQNRLSITTTAKQHAQSRFRLGLVVMASQWDPRNG